MALFCADDPSFAVVVPASSRNRKSLVVACRGVIRRRGRRGIREQKELREDVRDGEAERG